MSRILKTNNVASIYPYHTTNISTHATLLVSCCVINKLFHPQQIFYLYFTILVYQKHIIYNPYWHVVLCQRQIISLTVWSVMGALSIIFGHRTQMKRKYNKTWSSVSNSTYPLSLIPYSLSLLLVPYPLVLFLSQNLGEGCDCDSCDCPKQK